MPQLVRPGRPGAGDDPLSLAWRRSASSGLTPKNARPGAPDPRAARSHRLVEAARPVMDRLDSVLRDTGATLLLADREGRVVRTVRDDARLSRMLLRRGVDDGATLTEETVGNNGIGTALETRSGVFIRGEQHFAEMLRDFVCYGHPIIDPLTHRLVGAVNLSGMNEDASRLFAPFVRKIVADIEARYIDTARADDRELWHRFVERTRASDTATCAFGDEVVLASHSSLERLDSHDLVTLRRLVERDEVADVVELSVGTVGVLASRVGRRGHLLDLTFPDVPGPPDPPRRPRAPRATGASPEPDASLVASPTASPAASPTPAATVVPAVAVVGPSGSGRTTTARTIAGPDAVHVSLAEADSADSAWRDLAVPALRRLDGPNGPGGTSGRDGTGGPGGTDTPGGTDDPGTSGNALVLDDIDLLEDADLRRLAARIRAGRTGGSVVVVTTRDTPRPAVTEVLDACGRRTVLRPLHERGAETAAIVRAMTADLAAGHGLDAPTVTSRFVDAVCTLHLPNGLVSLRSALAGALDRYTAHPTGTLDADALPTRAARPPRAGELARGEYDAIVAALAECDGVRSRAARRLGISRTTLYARMKEFGLS